MIDSSDNEKGSVLVLVGVAISVAILAIATIPVFARISAARAEEQAVADQVALAGANALARAETSLAILDAIDYRFSQYISSTKVLLGTATALTALPAVGEVAAALIRPLSDLLENLIEWKQQYEQHVANPGRLGIKKIAPYYAVAAGMRVAEANGYWGVAIPVGKNLAIPGERQTEQLKDRVVIAIVYRKRQGVVSGRTEAGQLMAVSAAGIEMSKKRSLDIWTTDLVAKDNLGEGFNAIVNMLRSGDRLLAWARQLGEVALELTGNKEPKVPVYLPALAKTSQVLAQDKLRRLATRLSRNLYRRSSDSSVNSWESVLESVAK